MKKSEPDIDLSKYYFKSPEKAVFKLPKGLSEKTVKEISAEKGEPDWMLQKRLDAYKLFTRLPMPAFGPDLSKLNFDEITYYIKPSQQKARRWEDVPQHIKDTFDKLGVPESERKFLAGVEAMFESEAVYQGLRTEWAEKGIIFTDTDTAVKDYPEILKKHYGTVVPAHDNKFAALNSAVWSGGSFLIIPKGVKLEIPVQAYFRMNAKAFGQFERTLIVCEPGSKIHYSEGCTAPIYDEASLHAAVVECIAMKDAHLRYTTVQNWSSNVYNLVTKRAFAYENAIVEWVDGNIGCLTGDTAIISPSKGKILMQDLKKGDDILSLSFDDFEIKKAVVAAIIDNGKKKVYEMHVGGRKIVATANHPFLALTERRLHGSGHIKYFISWKQLRDIKKGDRIAYMKSSSDVGKPYKIEFVPQYIRNSPKIRIPDKTNEELMWLFGFYIGDGYIWRPKGKKSATVYFAAPAADRARSRVIETIQKQLSATVQLKEKVVVLSSIAFAQLIDSLGLGGNAHTKRVPPWIYTLPISQKLAFIEGYLDADGSVSKQHKQIIFTSCNKALLEDFQLLAATCGLSTYDIRTYSEKRTLLGKYMGRYTHHQFCVSKGDLPKIRSKIANSDSHIEFGRVKKITPGGIKQVYDIEVEGTHNFVANGIIVHNSGINMKYPAVYLKGRNSRAESLSIAYAGKGQYQDAGARVIHEAPNTTSTITSKNIAKNGGITSFRGTVRFTEDAINSKCSVKCDALLLDSISKNITYPLLQTAQEKSSIFHEARVGKVSEEQVFYLMSRGLSEDEATALIILGFIDSFIKELPLEYAVEFNRLIQLEMEKKLG